MATVEATGEVTGIQIRRCRGSDEFQACVALQKDVWGFSDVDIVPLQLFIVADKIGGQVLGAFDHADLIGFALAIPGTRGGHPYLHSHMLAVRPPYRDRGIGRSIKLFQREDALDRGFDLVEWTFDPLEIKNAWLNLEKLGAIARRYNINQYGTTSAPMHGGLPTDRLVAEWWIRSSRVQTLLQAGTRPDVSIEQEISVPAEIYHWKSSPAERPKAAEIQARNRQLFLDAFRRGLCAIGYARDAQGNGTFLLGKSDEQWKL